MIPVLQFFSETENSLSNDSAICMTDFVRYTVMEKTKIPRAECSMAKQSIISRHFQIARYNISALKRARSFYVSHRGKVNTSL